MSPYFSLQNSAALLSIPVFVLFFVAIVASTVFHCELWGQRTRQVFHVHWTTFSLCSTFPKHLQIYILPIFYRNYTTYWFRKKASEIRVLKTK